MDDHAAAHRLSAPGDYLLRLATVIDPSISFAIQQNSVPVIRDFTVTNDSDEELRDLRIEITSDPEFSDPCHILIERLAPNSTLRPRLPELRLHAGDLSHLTEAMKGELRFTASSGEQVLARHCEEIRLLSYDEWAGLQSLPEILAAFSQPNHPVIDKILSEAAHILSENGHPADIEGYQSGDPRRVWQITAAIYTAIARRGITYANPPASFETTGQKIRTPGRIASGGVATCLDLVMLLTACLEQAGLHPLALIHKGHAYAGVWLADESFPSPVVHDLQALRKRVQLHELLVFETTVITGPQPAAFEVAIARGNDHLERDDLFEMALDIRRARLQRIRPLPLRSDDGQILDESADPPASAAALPAAPEIPDALAVPLEAASESPHSRIERWKRRLLDLSLRNRLLNWKESKTTVSLICPDMDALEDALTAGHKIRFRSLETVLPNDDPRSRQAHQQRIGEDLLDGIVRDRLADGDVVIRLPQDELARRLTAIYRSARNAFEEGGANTLFLAFGFLAWQQKENTARSLLAPILLVPVTLERPSIRHGFTLVRHDDEARVNATLLELLQQDFQLQVPGIEPLPTRDESIDVGAVLRRLRKAVRDIAGWEVIDRTALGLFSFAKYLMWKDLQDRAAELAENPVVRCLLDPGTAPAPDTVEIPRPERLDEQYQPAQLFCPMVADSSQLAAVAAARAGKSFVLDGPPGTGKSQTITNIIADRLGEGKRVLFVSEKMAALDVVQRRLKDIGIAPFCLQLHSAKAKRADVVAQLAKTRQLAGTQTPNEWEQQASRIARLRGDLNDYVRELHQRHPNGWTAYRAFSCIIANRALPTCALSWAATDEHDQDAFLQRLETTQRLATLADAAGTARQGLTGLSHQEWSAAWETSFRQALAQMENAAANLASQTGLIQTALGLSPAALSFHAGEHLYALAQVLLEAPGQRPSPPSRLLQEEFRNLCTQAIAHGRQRNQLWNSLQNRYRPDALTLPITELKQQWRTATALWWPKSWLERRRIGRALRNVSNDGAIPTADMIGVDLATLERIREEDGTLAHLAESLAAPLAHWWQSAATDWDRLANLSAWGERAQFAFWDVGGDTPEPQKFVQQLVDRLDHDPGFWMPGASLFTQLKAFTEAWNTMASARRQFERIVSVDAALVWGEAGQPAYATRTVAHCQRWSQHLTNLRHWCTWQAARHDAQVAGLQPLLALLDQDALVPANLPAAFEYNYARWWAGRLIEDSPALRTFVGAEQTRKIEDFRVVDKQFTQLTGAYIAARLSEGVPAVHAEPGSGSEMGILQREIQKRSRHLPLRRLIESIPHALTRLAPCFLMSPLSVAQYLDAGYPAFDVVIFDEASQIPVWDAVGVIARGRQVIIAGDPRQLPPTSFFGRAEDDEDDSGGDLLVDMESILDECLASRLPQLSLRWHYRSRNESLITFSNRRYYDNNLYTFPSPVTHDNAVRLHPVEGIYDRSASRTNRKEAETVADFILQRLQSASTRKTMPSIGVVTFNQPQQTLINDLLDQARQANPELDSFFSSELDEPVFVKNLENVQGDERDVMIFSITYGPDASGRFSLGFGPLNRGGGERRLNVAITRARVELHVFSSLSADQINLATTLARGVHDLKLFLDYASRGPRAIVEAVQAPLGETESPFEEEVLRRLTARGWTVHAQIGCSGYRIDLAVVDPRTPGRYLLGIECDGAMYHSAATARDRDRLRALVLKRLGWSLYRIWSTDWWTNAEAELQKLEAVLQQRLKMEPPSDPIQDEAPAPASSAPTADAPPSPSGAEPNQRMTPLLASGIFSAATAPAPARATHEPLLPAYRAVTLPAMQDQEVFYQPSTDAALRESTLRVIAAEGPIAEALLVRRISDAWGFQRAGSRIRSRILALIPRVLHRTEEDGETYYWPEDIDSKTWTDFRVADHDPSSHREVGSICRQELANTLCHAIAQHAGVSEEQAIRDALRLMGIGRLTQQIEHRMQLAINDLLRAHRVIAQSGSLIIPR